MESSAAPQPLKKHLPGYHEKWIRICWIEERRYKEELFDDRHAAAIFKEHLLRNEQPFYEDIVFLRV